MTDRSIPQDKLFTSRLAGIFVDKEKKGWFGRKKIVTVFKLTRDMIYWTGNPDSPEMIIVSEGFETDGASIPKVFWSVIGSPLLGRYRNAAVLHDYLYATNLFDKKRCDDLFLEAMGVLGVQLWKRRTMYRAVRMFGGRPYKKGGKQ